MRVQFLIRIEPAILKYLRRLKRTTGVSISAWIEQAIRERMERIDRRLDERLPDDGTDIGPISRP